MATEKAFRAVIIGGGPVGLLAGHAFAKAGIDYIILERRKEYDLVSGASTALWPHNVRTLDQLGMREEAESLYMPVQLKTTLLRDGTVISTSNQLEQIAINHGHPWMCFHRAKLVEMLYRRLPDHENKVFLNKEVVSIETTETGVTVKCADETTFSGSIIVGADGIYSTVRKHINESLKSSGKLPEEDAPQPFRAVYRGLYGNGPPMESLEPGMYYETHGDGLTVQLIVAEKELQFLIYERLSEPQQATLQRFTAEDQEAMAASFADVRFTPKITFADLWAAKRWSTLDVLPEGVVPTWHEGRAVLVGDAAHRMMPNSGLGVNTGWQDVIELTNRLHKALGTPDIKNLELTEIEDLFQGYHASRIEVVQEGVQISANQARITSWNNWLWKFLDAYVLPRINGDIHAAKRVLGPFVQKGILFDFLGERGFREGILPWKNAPNIITSIKT